jgi:putative hydrolase of HD superfamily
VDEDKAIADQVRHLDQGDEIRALIREFNSCNSIESRISKDADQLDLILELKEQLDFGNPNAKEWMHYALQRLHTENAKKMAEEILITKSSDWWFEKRTDWWVSGSNNEQENR